MVRPVVLGGEGHARSTVRETESDRSSRASQRPWLYSTPVMAACIISVSSRPCRAFLAGPAMLLPPRRTVPVRWLDRHVSFLLSSPREFPRLLPPRRSRRPSGRCSFSVTVGKPTVRQNGHSFASRHAHAPADRRGLCWFATRLESRRSSEEPNENGRGRYFHSTKRTCPEFYIDTSSKHKGPQ
jgi:hypothetical protein